MKCEKWHVYGSFKSVNIASLSFSLGIATSNILNSDASLAGSQVEGDVELTLFSHMH